MTVPQPVSFRAGSLDDAVTIAALSVQVFLDTYARHGVRPDLAREAFAEYSELAFSARLSVPGRRFVLAWNADALLGFAEVDCDPGTSPVAGLQGAELVRLYVQPQSQRSGLGTALLGEAERIALSSKTRTLWLTAWEENARALAFYARSGYADVGASIYSFEGREYANRVFSRELSS